MKEIREQAKSVSVSTYLPPHEPCAHATTSLQGEDSVFVLHQNERGRKGKTNSQITEELIPFLKAGSGEGRQGKRKGRRIHFSGGLFLCVNSSTLFNF